MIIMWGARETISGLSRGIMQVVFNASLIWGIMLAVFYDDYAGCEGNNLQPEQGYYAGCRYKAKFCVMCFKINLKGFVKSKIVFKNYVLNH